MNPIEDGSSTDGDGESIAASEMDTDTVRRVVQVVLTDPCKM